MQLREHSTEPETLPVDPIFRYSPHLAGGLDRAGIRPQGPVLSSAFAFAIEHGGLLELDFVREAGVSFNPRPARIGLILLKDVGTRSVGLLAAGFLACSDAAARFELEQVSEFEAPLLLAEQARAGAEALLHSAGRSAEAVDLALALELDRARHRHQALSEEAKKGWGNFLAEVEQYLALARSVEHPLLPMLDHWYQRASRHRDTER